jgi:hypothetical protein
MWSGSRWNIGQKDWAIQFLKKASLNSIAAGRLNHVMNRVPREYAARYRQLRIESGDPRPSESLPSA